MSVHRRVGRARFAVSWLGLCAVAGGLVLVWLYFDHPQLARSENPLVALIYVGTGCILIVWGLRALLGEIVGVIGRLRSRPAQRYRVHMPREAFLYGLILLALGFGALLGRNNMLMLVFGLMAGPFILNGQVTLASLKRLRVTRLLPDHATAGEKLSVKLTLSNRKRFLSSWMVKAEDTLQSLNEHLRPSVLFTRVPPRSQREATYEIRPARRGLIELGPIRVTSRFPLGLMERSFELGGIEELVVYPRIGHLKPSWQTQTSMGECFSERAQVRVGAADDEYHGLREYRGGDNPRAIHWRTTARRNELMVREFQYNRRNDLVILVDLWVPARPEPMDLERVELAVSFAASICVDQTRTATDSVVELAICGKEVQSATSSAGMLAIGGVLERLALAEAGPADGLAEALRVACASAPGRARRILITTRPRAVAQAALAATSELLDLDGTAGFEIVRADAEEIAAYMEFDEIPTPAG